MKNKILICFGTRPEWLKVKSLVELLDKSQYNLLFTGQHPDLLKNINVDFKMINRLNHFTNSQNPVKMS